MPDASFAQEDALVGTQMGSCKLLAMIGAGGMARVYIAKHRIHRKDVAVKVLPGRMCEDQEYVIRFQREAESAKKIQHPNVVRVLEFGQQDQHHYMVMEYLPGESLTSLIRRNKRLPFDQATELLVEIAAGLEAAHGQGIIHRDIKPSNILLGKDGTPKISDFGLAREAGTARGITVEGMFMGTPEYVSPEQAQGHPVSFTTDIYSLGIAYYEMLTGTLPFRGTTHVEVAMARLTKPPKPVQEAFPGVDPRAIPIVQKMMRREPENRYQSATELLADLRPLVKAKKKRKTVIVESPAADAVLPGDVKWRLSGRSSIVTIGPGLALLAIGGLLAPGAADWSASIAALAKSSIGLAVAGAGLLALAWSCIHIRRELRDSKRAMIGITGFGLAGVFALVATATLDRKELAAQIIAPANLMLATIGLMWAAVAASFEQDEDTPPTWIQKGVLAVAWIPWFAAAAAGNLVGPFKNIPRAVEMSALLIVPMLFFGVMGVIVSTARRSTRRMRWIGISFLAAGGTLMWTWGAAGSRGLVGTPSEWSFAIFESIKSLPSRMPRSGALLLLGMFLIPISLRLVRNGLIRHYSQPVAAENVVTSPGEAVS